MPTSTPSRSDPDRKPRPIAHIARDLGLTEDEWIPYGHDKAKIRVSALAARRERPDGKLVVVSSITPTPAGDGKTTMTIGLGQALWRVGGRPVVALREPSIGPTLGMKGGGTGGGRSQVVPMDEINLHFTGDFHAITSAHNLLAAALDNHVHHGNPLGIDVRQVAWKRILDVNDRALRNVVVGLGGRMDGVPREGGFLITSASEIMAALCLAEDLTDLKQRLGRMLVALTGDGNPVTADALGVTGAMAALLRDAIHPNLVQTMEGTPALVHGGPFANIAHGCNSVLATRLALKLGDVCLTEAGFATDLGAEKFFDIKCRLAGLKPDAAMIVATARALKYHGRVPVPELDRENVAALTAGLDNLEAHVEAVRQFKVPVLIGLNRYPSDTEREYAAVRERCRRLGVDVHVADVMGNLGRLSQDRGRYSEAVSYFERALKILDLCAHPRPAILAKALNDRGVLHALMRSPREAEFCLKRALAIGEAGLGPEHSAVAGILSNYAVVLRKLKRAVEAKSLEQRAKTILEKSAQTARLGYTVDLRELQSSRRER